MVIFSVQAVLAFGIVPPIDSPELGASSPPPDTYQPEHTHPPHSLPATTQSVRVLVLPVDHTHPYYTTVELYGNLNPTGSIRWTPQLDSIIGPNDAPASAVVIKGEADKLLRYPLQIYFEVPPDRMGQSSAARPNICARSLTEMVDCPWKGNIVVLKFNGSRRRGYKNTEDADMPTIRSFLLQHQSYTSYEL
ncbi:hypothetical protein BDV93DRAFT_556939 [Ceratobasidium sp. AG-I]|nr:hypothetical protein BDV93DRAFT_556939 [Ceratobasidium sp. AG-I]